MSATSPPQQTSTTHHHRHAVAIPSPGRGHINPMLNLCTLLAQRSGINITVIVTEEWLDLLTTNNNNPTNNSHLITFLTIPNVLPSERIRGHDHPGFIESLHRDMPAPVAQVLDKLILTSSSKPDVIIADTYLSWVVGLGAKRGIPVASFWSMSASMLSLLYHDLIPKIPINPSELSGMDTTLRTTIESMDCMRKAQFLILRTVDEIEEPAIEDLRTALSIPVYPTGPAIPYFKTQQIHHAPISNNEEKPPPPDYIQWLNVQPERSVLYVSLGTVVPVSSDQLDELADALKRSGTKVLWVAKDGAERLMRSTGFDGETGMVVPWCDQMRVLLHSAVGGFLTHCGWNSTLESGFAGVPVLALPFIWDQIQNCKMMVDEWGIGWRLERNGGGGGNGLVMRDEVCESVKRFMDLGSDERRMMDENCEKLKKKVSEAVDEDGSTTSLQEFVETAFKH